MPAPFDPKVVALLKPRAEEYGATIGARGTQDAARLEAREQLLADLANQSAAVGHPYTTKQLDGWYKNHLRTLKQGAGKETGGGPFAKSHRPKTLWELVPRWHADRIADLIPADTPQGEYLAKYAAARKQVFTELTAEERKELEDELARREKVGLPHTQQQK